MPGRFFTLGLAFLSATVVSCGPQRRPEPTYVAPSTLHRLFRETPDLARGAYVGRPVRCRLPAGGYRCAPSEVHWYTGLPGSRPAVVFRFREGAPSDATHPIEVVGTCNGLSLVDTPTGPEKRVVVDDCVTVTPPGDL